MKSLILRRKHKGLQAGAPLEGEFRETEKSVAMREKGHTPILPYRHRYDRYDRRDRAGSSEGEIRKKLQGIPGGHGGTGGPQLLERQGSLRRNLETEGATEINCCVDKNFMGISMKTERLVPNHRGEAPLFM